MGKFDTFSLKIFFVVLALGLTFGLLFHLIKEPIPSLFTDFFSSTDLLSTFIFIIFSSLVIAISEQMIFAGVLFNSYRDLTSKYDAYFQTSIIFAMFHLLRFRVLVEHYYVYFRDIYMLYLIMYYLLLLAFMFAALYLYSFRTTIHGKKVEGNFFYPVALHFAADFGLFAFVVLSAL